jgi:rfaE bifunctional protein nucleotidyltransferase chain/domain
MVIPFHSLEDWREEERASGRQIVATNGCFDLLHVGHLRYLRAAAELGPTLIVGINDDAGVRTLKGPDRPLNVAAERAEMLDGLKVVSAVTIFPGPRAVEFLEKLKPDIYVKGGDYTLDDLYPPEREVMEQSGTDIRILPLVPGKSTTHLIESMKAGNES